MNMHWRPGSMPPPSADGRTAAEIVAAIPRPSSFAAVIEDYERAAAEKTAAMRARHAAYEVYRSSGKSDGVHLADARLQAAETKRSELRDRLRTERAAFLEIVRDAVHMHRRERADRLAANLAPVRADAEWLYEMDRELERLGGAAARPASIELDGLDERVAKSRRR